MLQRLLLALALMVGVAAPAWATPTTTPIQPGDGGPLVAVRVAPGRGVQIAVRAANDRGTPVRFQSEAAGLLLLEMPEVGSASATTLPGVIEVLPSVEMRAADLTATSEPSDPLYPGAQRAISRRIGLPQVWARDTGSSAVTIAILDTGVDATHPDLAGNVLPGIDFVNRDHNAHDDNGHGTAAAGVAAALGDNGRGIAGACPSCSILPVKVLDAGGAGSSALVAAGIVYAVDAGADVISMSLSGPTRSGLEASVDYALAHGVTVVAAAGNLSGSSDDPMAPTEPAALPGVIGVAATDLYDRAEPFSRQGPWVDLAVPGRLTTTAVGGGYQGFVGTSASTPLVAGVAGLLRSTLPGASEVEVRRALHSGVVSADVVVAHGRLDAAAALSALVSNSKGITAMPAGGTPLMGDWDGDGVDTPGVHRGDRFHLRNSPTAGPAEVVLRYGRNGDKPVVGDWDGDGVDTIGVVRGNRFILRNEYRSGADDIALEYGRNTDTPVVGDWDGNGTDTLGVVRGNKWILRNVYRSGADDIVMYYGNATDTPVVGDWDGNGTDTLGVVRGNKWILRNVYRSGADDIVMYYGRSTDAMVVGDHDGDGTVTLGVVREDRWILRNNYGRPYEDRVFAY